jgi:hypothetical protein
MNDAVKEAGGKTKKQSAKPTASAILRDGSLVEMVYRPEEDRTLFCVAKDGMIRYEEALFENNERLVPYSPRNNLLRSEVVLFPSEAARYGSEAELIGDIRSFIHGYVDLSPLFEEIASYYVFFSWVYDAFNELAYLRVRGDAGSGKTRFLLCVGSLCYKPIFASGASTVSPLFRILDSMNGTLIVDEGDFRFSDEKAELVKILNNGNGRGFPVLRSESVSGREFSPRAYSVFGPKLIATRGYFQDRALESRCLTEETGGRRLREDIPINLSGDYKREALALRNKLLMFRLKNYGSRTADPGLVDRTVEPRLAQVFTPLLSVIDDPGAKQSLQDLLRQYDRDLVVDRGMDIEAQVLEVVRNLKESPYCEELSIQEITTRFADLYGENFERKITPHWIGQIIRRRLQLKTMRTRTGYVIAASEQAKLNRLFERYGIDGPPVNLVNSVNSPQGSERADNE